MPHVDFSALPPNARVWVFGAAAPLGEAAQRELLAVVDQHLSSWRAHGMPLVCARDWRDERFVAVGVDEAATGASGCSIDGLFRTLTTLQEQLGVGLVGGGVLFWRGVNGAIESGPRSAFVAAAERGDVSAATSVFDPTVMTAGDWRAKFERPAGRSWHARMLPPPNTPIEPAT